MTITGDTFYLNLQSPGDGLQINQTSYKDKLNLDWVHLEDGETKIQIQNTGNTELEITGVLIQSSDPIWFTYDLMVIISGMASLAASLGRKSKETCSFSLDDDLNDYVAEGVEAMVPYKGTVTDILKQLTGAVRSGLSYCGAHTTSQMQDNAEFIKMSGAGFAES